MELPERYELNPHACSKLLLEKRSELGTARVVSILVIFRVEPRVRWIVVGERLLELVIPLIQLSKQMRRHVKV